MLRHGAALSQCTESASHTEEAVFKQQHKTRSPVDWPMEMLRPETGRPETRPCPVLSREQKN